MKVKIKYNKNWLSEEEINKLFKYPEIPSRDLLLMKLCYYGALRISEALNSKREDYIVENEEYYLLLRVQKTDKKNWEKTPITEEVYGDLKRYCNSNDIWEQNYVFSSKMSDKLSYPMAYVIVKKWAKECGLNKEISTHTFRRSMASNLLNRGMPLEKVSLLLRHKRLDTTMTYLKISKSQLYKEMKEILSKNNNN